MVERYHQGIDRAQAGMVVDEGLRAYMLKVYNYMASGVLLTGIVALLTATSPAISNMIFTVQDGYLTYTGLGWIAALSPLAFVIFMSFGAHRMSTFMLQAMFWAFAAVMGLSLSSIFFFYTGGSIANIFFITAAAFGSLSLWGYTTKKDISGWGAFLFMGLIGLIIALIANWVIGSAPLMYALSIFGVLLFAGLTAYDTQKIKNMYFLYEDGTVAQKGAIMGALALYLDFINMFRFLLYIFGGRD